MTTNERLAARAKALRTDRGLTQAQLVNAAVKAGHTLCQPTYSTLERGTRNWNAKYIDAVAAGLGEDPAVFIAEPEGPLARVDRAARDFFDALVDAVRTPGIAG